LDVTRGDLDNIVGGCVGRNEVAVVDDWSTNIVRNKVTIASIIDIGGVSGVVSGEVGLY
jgi:hypothetical protein